VLQDKVKAKIDELLEGDIIERVEGPTTWASPVVVAPKPSGEIRLCVDMGRVNEAIIRERLPIPAVDEVLEELNGTTVFSKLQYRSKESYDPLARRESHRVPRDSRNARRDFCRARSPKNCKFCSLKFYRNFDCLL